MSDRGAKARETHLFPPVSHRSGDESLEDGPSNLTKGNTDDSCSIETVLCLDEEHFKNIVLHSFQYQHESELYTLVLAV